MSRRCVYLVFSVSCSVPYSAGNPNNKRGELHNRGHCQQLRPAGGAELLERIELIGLKCGANLLGRHVWPAIESDNSVATAQRLAQHVVPEMSRIRLKIPYSATSWSGRSREFTIASPNNRDASVMNSLYNDSRSRSFHSALARIDCLRWLIHVVPMEAVAPTNEPSAAARAVTTVESMIQGRQENIE